MSLLPVIHKCNGLNGFFEARFLSFVIDSLFFAIYAFSRLVLQGAESCLCSTTSYDTIILTILLSGLKLLKIEHKIMPWHSAEELACFKQDALQNRSKHY